MIPDWDVIRSPADPGNRLVETDDTNNTVVMYVELTGDRIILLPSA